MKIQRFEDLIAWQKAKELTVWVYRNTAVLKDYGFKDQIQRASVATMNDLAEGFERRTIKDKLHFFYMGKGSVGEVRSMVILGRELGYFTKEQYEMGYKLSLEVVRLISGLISSQPSP